MSEILYRQMRLPVLQNKVYQDQEKALNVLLGDVELIQCADTGLVYNHLFDPDVVKYDTNYQNEQAHSPTFQHHLQQVKECVLNQFGHLGKGVEIGCGKGYFLEMLCQSGADIMGFDPAYEGENIRVRKDYFRGVLDGERPDYIILRHVLEHITRPWDFLESLSAKSKKGCGIYIEVPCFDWIVENRAFYDIFYEHCNYFNLNVLDSAFGSIWKSGRFFGDQYLYVIADLRSFQSPSVEKIRRYSPLVLNELLAQLLLKRNDDSRTYVWGGGAKGITFSNILHKHNIHVDGIIDINPHKQGKYIGFSGMKIQSPEETGKGFCNSNVFVMNPVYKEEISETISAFNANLILVT